MDPIRRIDRALPRPPVEAVPWVRRPSRDDAREPEDDEPTEEEGGREPRDDETGPGHLDVLA